MRIGRNCPHQSHKAKVSTRTPLHARLVYTPRGRPLLGGPGPAPSSGWSTHSLAADIECEQGMASAGGLVQGMS